MKPSEKLRDFVTITLITSDDGGLVVRSVEMIGPVCRARFSLVGEVLTTEVFHPEASSALKTLSERIIHQRGLLALPDFEVELEGLLLADCRVVATEARGGGLQILIRFKHFSGDLLLLFSDDYKLREKIVGPSEFSAIDRLFEKAYIPLLDIADHILEIEKNPSKYMDSRLNVALIDIAKRIKRMEVRSFAAGAESSPENVRFLN